MKLSGHHASPGRRTALLVLALLIIALAGCDRARPLVIATHPWATYELMHLAKAEGWLGSADVQLLSTNSASESLHALRARQADAAALTLDEVLRARAEGIPLTVVLVFDISAGADMLLARPDITRLEQLRGRRIGAETGALGALMLERVLDAAGLTRADVEVRSVPVDAHESVWTGGDVDALITYEPIASRLIDAGARRLIDSRSLPDTVIDVLAVRRDTIGPHRRALRQLVHGHFVALRYLRRNLDDAAYRIGAGLGISADEVRDGFAGVKLPGPDRNRALLRPGGPLSESAADLAAILVDGGWLDRTPDPDGLTDSGFLPSD